MASKEEGELGGRDGGSIAEGPWKSSFSEAEVKLVQINQDTLSPRWEVKSSDLTSTDFIFFLLLIS